jgi:hypothetical protein
MRKFIFYTFLLETILYVIDDIYRDYIANRMILLQIIGIVMDAFISFAIPFTIIMDFIISIILWFVIKY